MGTTYTNYNLSFIVSFAICSFALPVRAGSCGVMTITAAGDDLTALQDKAFTAFKDKCRQEKTCREYKIQSK